MIILTAFIVGFVVGMFVAYREYADKFIFRDE